MTNIKENYKSKVKTYQPKPPYVWNCVKAFLVGGLICMIGQGLQNFYIHFLILTKNSRKPYGGNADPIVSVAHRIRHL